MQGAATVIGYIVVVLLAIGVAAAGLAYFGDKVVEWHSGLVVRGVSNHLRERGRQMSYQKSWFSDPTQRAMWMACADTMQSPNYPDPQYIRDTLLPQLLAQEQIP